MGWNGQLESADVSAVLLPISCLPPLTLSTLGNRREKRKALIVFKHHSNNSQKKEAGEILSVRLHSLELVFENPKTHSQIHLLQRSITLMSGNAGNILGNHLAFNLSCSISQKVRALDVHCLTFKTTVIKMTGSFQNNCYYHKIRFQGSRDLGVTHQN